VNLKELTSVKELVEDAVDKIGYIVEVLEQELGDGGPVANDGNESDMEPSGQESDTPPDPLEDARIAGVQAYDILGAILDVTEPHRKRFAAQSRVARPSGNRVATAPVADPRQVEIPELEEKGGRNGQVKKSRIATRPIRRA